MPSGKVAKVVFHSLDDTTSTGVTWIDATNKTVDSNNLLSGETALKNDGTDVVGSIASKSSSDLTASGATVTVPAGYYAEQASKSVASGTAGTPTATKGTVNNHSVTITPSVTNTTGYITGGTKTGTAVSVSASELVSGTLTISSSGTKDVTNYASASVADGSATTPATSITANPSISVSASGLITATASASKSVTPTVSAGYVSSGTAGTVTVSGSNTQQLSTQAAATITPSTTSQTAVAAGKYTTGAVTVDPIPSQYIVPSGTKEIIENGEGIDVSSYAAVNVAVPGQTPTGIKYIWTEDDGAGAWDVGGYEYCSVDGAPVKDNRCRLWVDCSDIEGPTQITVTMWYDTKQGETHIDWGDGSSEDAVSSTITYAFNHTISTPRKLVIDIQYVSGSGKIYAVSANLQNRIIYYEASALNTTSSVPVFGNGTASNAAQRLKRVYMSDSCQSAGTAANCIALEEIRLPSGIKAIANGAFNNCVSLKKVIVPSTVTTIYGSAFSDCTSMQEIHFLPTTPPTANSSDCFYHLPTTCVIYVPVGSLSAYQSATNFSKVASQMQEEPQ